MMKQVIYKKAFDFVKYSSVQVFYTRALWPYNFNLSF